MCCVIIRNHARPTHTHAHEKNANLRAHFTQHDVHEYVGEFQQACKRAQRFHTQSQYWLQLRVQKGCRHRGGGRGWKHTFAHAQHSRVHALRQTRNFRKTATRTHSHPHTGTSRACVSGKSPRSINTRAHATTRTRSHKHNRTHANTKTHAHTPAAAMLSACRSPPQ